MTVMALRARVRSYFQQESVNFWLTNCLGRNLMTRFMGWFSKIEQPFICSTSIVLWKFFADLDLSDARETEFRSLHACFTRRLRPGARPIDADPASLVSPCDGIIGATGRIDGTTMLQAKGQCYTLEDLLLDDDLIERYRDGCYATLRLTSGMYHRFHAPLDCRVRHVTYISGDTWNVNPIALKRVERLFCKNERAVIRLECLASGVPITLVPVAAVLVASIRLHCLDVLLSPRYRGANEFTCDTNYARGQEMGWFEHGSTIIVLAPESYRLHPHLTPGGHIRMGQALLRRVAGHADRV